jgi:hypothetical protein
MSVGAELLGLDAELVARDVEDRAHRRMLGNGDVALRIAVLVGTLGQFPSPLLIEAPCRP